MWRLTKLIKRLGKNESQKKYLRNPFKFSFGSIFYYIDNLLIYFQVHLVFVFSSDALILKNLLKH